MKLNLFLGALFLLAFNLHAQISGEVARYFLNGNANNAAGTNSGTVVGATVTADRFGQPASAYHFNGSGNRIDFAAPPITQVSNWTITAWIKPDNFSQSIAVMVGSDNGSSSDGFGFGFNGNSTLQGFTPFLSGYFSSGQALASTGQWYHIAMERDTGPIKFFVNGVQTPNTGNAPNYYPPTDFTIGGQNGVRYFAGSVDDVRIFNRALSPGEVTQVYNSAEVCTPHAATATATVVNGFFVGATITDSGCGYTNVPSVVIQGGGGTNAAATATVSNGVVTAINIVNPGCCYTNPPTIIIDDPPFVPTLYIVFSKIKVTQGRLHVGHNYVLEATTNFHDWFPAGPQFTAQTNTVVSEFDLDLTGRYFRMREVP